MQPRLRKLKRGPRGGFSTIEEMAREQQWMLEEAQLDGAARVTTGIESLILSSDGPEDLMRGLHRIISQVRERTER